MVVQWYKGFDGSHNLCYFQELASSLYSARDILTLVLHKGFEMIENNPRSHGRRHERYELPKCQSNRSNLLPGSTLDLPPHPTASPLCVFLSCVLDERARDGDDAVGLCPSQLPQIPQRWCWAVCCLAAFDRGDQTYCEPVGIQC